jgi:hypothetical protein
VMAGWQKPTAPPVKPTWAHEVRKLYERSLDMEVTEFEALLTVAMRGERPDHPGLPAYLGLIGLPPMRSGGTVR